MDIEDFKRGDKVVYIPNHAHGDAQHPDCERGVVSSKNDTFVFVRYRYDDGRELGKVGQATSPENLIFEDV